METTVELQQCKSKEAIIARVRSKGGDRVLCSVCLGFCFFCRFWKILDWVMSKHEARVMRRGRSLKKLWENDVLGKIFGDAEPDFYLVNGDTKAHRLFHEANQSQRALWEAFDLQHH